MRAVGADVARDLRQLVDRHEDLVVALELEVEVVARDAGDGLGVEAGEARDAVVLVDDDVARAQVGEASAAGRGPLRVGRVDALRRWISRCSGNAASLRPGATKPSRRLASVKIRPVVRAVERRLDAGQVVGGALGGAALRPRDDGRVAGARELLQLGLGLLERARGEVGGLRADLDRLVGGDRLTAATAARSAAPAWICVGLT